MTTPITRLQSRADKFGLRLTIDRGLIRLSLDGRCLFETYDPAKASDFLVDNRRAAA
jgi:hypothetical protein